MMEATELRIGNYVNTGDIVQSLPMVAGVLCAVLIANIFQSFGAIRKFNQLKPIPLTEQWVIDFGFKVNNDCGGNGFQLGNMILFKVHESSNDWFYEVEYHYKNFDKRTTIIGRYDYVHQLQNLYFALTNKELIKK